MISSVDEPQGPHGGAAHPIYKTGLVEPAIVNIQPRGKMAKPYQCRQVAGAVKAKLKGGQ